MWRHRVGTPTERGPADRRARPLRRAHLLPRARLPRRPLAGRHRRTSARPAATASGSATCTARPGPPLHPLLTQADDVQCSAWVERDGLLYLLTTDGAPRWRLAVTDPAHARPRALARAGRRGPRLRARRRPPAGAARRARRCSCWPAAATPSPSWRCTTRRRHAARRRPAARAGVADRPVRGRPRHPGRSRAAVDRLDRLRHPEPGAPLRERRDGAGGGGAGRGRGAAPCGARSARSPRPTARPSACSSLSPRRRTRARGPRSSPATAASASPASPPTAPPRWPGSRRAACYALVSLRGGGEEGDAWHLAGNRAQQAERVRRLPRRLRRAGLRGHTTTNQLSIMGGSNGGLLVGAALTQRPAAYRAVVCSAPLLDMVRYEEFSLGRTWNDEYGTAADPEELGWLLSYSPYHHVEPGTGYPAVLFTVFESDTRVDPLHARKMCAALQHATQGRPRDAPDPAAPRDRRRPRRPVGHAHGRARAWTSWRSSPPTPGWCCPTMTVPSPSRRHRCSPASPSAPTDAGQSGCAPDLPVDRQRLPRPVRRRDLRQAGSQILLILLLALIVALVPAPADQPARRGRHEQPGHQADEPRRGRARAADRERPSGPAPSARCCGRSARPWSASSPSIMVLARVRRRPRADPRLGGHRRHRDRLRRAEPRQGLPLRHVHAAGGPVRRRRHRRRRPGQRHRRGRRAAHHDVARRQRHALVRAQRRDPAGGQQEPGLRRRRGGRAGGARHRRRRGRRDSPPGSRRSAWRSPTSPRTCWRRCRSLGIEKVGPEGSRCGSPCASQPGRQFAVQRALNAALSEAFDRAGLPRPLRVPDRGTAPDQ